MIEALNILAWPVTVLIAIFVLRPYMAKLLSGSKIKLSLFAQSVEMTLRELKEIMTEQTGESLTELELEKLTQLYRDVTKDYPDGVKSPEREELRPLRNYGLIMTLPKGQSLGHAKFIQLTALGRLFMSTKLHERKD